MTNTLNLPRFYLRLMVLPFILFTSVALLLRTQPYNQQLRLLLPPAGCPAPCFMGIRPGVTTAKESMTLLQSDARVSLVRTINPDRPYQIWWAWNDQAPEFLRTSPLNPTFPVNGQVQSNGPLVSAIYFSPDLTLGDIVLEWGLPPTAQLIFGGIITTPDRSVTAIIELDYPSEGFWASAAIRCPYNTDLWQAPAQITITNEFNGFSLGTIRPIDRGTFMKSIHRTSNLMCGL